MWRQGQKNGALVDARSASSEPELHLGVLLLLLTFALRFVSAFVASLLWEGITGFIVQLSGIG